MCDGHRRKKMQCDDHQKGNFSTLPAKILHQLLLFLKLPLAYLLEILELSRRYAYKMGLYYDTKFL